MRHKPSPIRQSYLQDFTTALRETVCKSVPAPRYSDADLLAFYPEGDPHNGMYSWAKEAGANFDLRIAERRATSAVDILVSRAPAAHTGILFCAGDLLHSDTKQNRTEASGHPLDCDTRWVGVMQATLRIKKRQVYRMLQKHQRVIIRIAEGNHDQQAAFSIAMALGEHFRLNRRVTVDLSPNNYWYFRWGAVLLGGTHGHTQKPDRLPAIMAADCPEWWGLTRYRVFFQGHLHHKWIKEFPGCVVEILQTLAGRDAWAHSHGYRAGQSMQCITYHKRFGEIGRISCPVEMIGMKS